MTEPVPPHIAEIKSARRRAESMGKAHGWMPEFNAHPLAACIDNHTACIDAEVGDTQDSFAVMCWLLNMARAVNRFCDAHRVAGSAASEYWLERFVWVNGRFNGTAVNLVSVGA